MSLKDQPSVTGNVEKGYAMEVETYPSDRGSGDEVESKLTFGKLLAMAGFIFGYISDVAVLQMTSGALATINADIGPSPDYTWMSIVQTLTVAAMAPFIGRLSDIYGRRNFLLLGNVCGMIGCVVASTARTVNTVIGGAVLIGFGGVCHQLAWACMCELVTHKSRSTALGILEACLTPSSVFGPLLAFTFITYSTWRNIYWLCFAIDGTAFIFVFFFYHPIQHDIREVPEDTQTKFQRFKALDWIGLGTFTTGLVLFLVGLSFGGKKYPWVSAGCLTPMLIGIVLLITCGLYSSKTNTPYPMFPREAFGNVRGFTVILASVFLLGMLYYSSAILWPLQVQALYTKKKLTAGLYGMAGGGGGVIGSPLFGTLATVTGHHRWWLVFMVVAMTVSMGAQAIVSPSSHIGSTILTILVSGFVGGVQAVSTTMISLGVSHEHLGVAAGLSITFRSVGGSVASTIYQSILANDLKSQIESRVVKLLVGAGVPLSSVAAATAAVTAGNTNSPALAGLSSSTLSELFYEYKLCYSHAFRLVYLVSISFGVLGIVASVFAADIDHLLTNKIDTTLREGAHLHDAPTEEQQQTKEIDL